MTNIHRLPKNWLYSFRRASAASDAFGNYMTLYHPDFHTVYSHFLGDALPSEWGAAATVGASSAVTVGSGKMTLTTDANDNDSCGQGYGLFWKGDRGFTFECTTDVEAESNAKLEIGITDVLSDAGAINVKSTPTATATDACVVIYDTDDIVNSTRSELISVKSGIVSRVVAPETLDVWFDNIYSFRGQGDTVDVFRGSTQDETPMAGASIAVGQGSIEGGVNITPWWFVQTRTTAAKALGVQWFVMTGPSGAVLP